MSATFMTVNGPELDLSLLGEQCEAEIVERILRGEAKEWMAFYESSDAYEMASLVRNALKAPGDVAIGEMSLALTEMAKFYAAEYVQKHGDPEDLAIDLGLLEIA